MKTQYIDKSAIVAEIEELEDEAKKCPSDFGCGRLSICKELMNFLDALEVKEVNLEKEINLWFDYGFPNDEELLDYIKETAKRFFELGLSAQTSTVWHYVSEEIPTKFGNPIIVASKNKNKEDGIWLYDLIQSWEGEWNPRVNWENPVKWAYMDDLLK